MSKKKIEEAAALLGKIGGSKKSQKKTIANRINIKKRWERVAKELKSALKDV
jgi:hypothetical protein